MFESHGKWLLLKDKLKYWYIKNQNLSKTLIKNTFICSKTIHFISFKITFIENLVLKIQIVAINSTCLIDYKFQRINYTEENCLVHN